MQRRLPRPALYRSSQRSLSFTIIAVSLLMTLGYTGCQSASVLLPRPLQPRGSGGEATRTLTIAQADLDAMETLVPVAEEEQGNDTSATVLLEEALASVPEDSTADLGTRMQMRKLRIPRPPRGSNARFNFGGGRRGWITALPSNQLLTSPAYGRGRVFLGGGFSSTQFFAVNAFTGELDWALQAPDGGPTAAIIKDEWVIFNTESCTIFVANAETGELLWSRWLGDPLMSQPVAAGGLVFSAYPKRGGGGYEFGAFRLSDGTPVWQVQIAADVIQAPQIQGDSVYFATMDGRVYRVRRRDGRVLWTRDVQASSALWVDENSHVMLSRRLGERSPQEQMIILATTDGRMLRQGEMFPAPYLNGGTRDRRLISGQAGAWGSSHGGERLGLTNVASGWAFQGSSPAVDNGRAYFAVGGEIRARDMDSGQTVWRRVYSDADRAQAVSPPAVVGSQLIFGTIDGHLYAADIDTGMVIWAYDVGEPIHFQPVIAQGWVYVTTGRGNLIGLEVGDPGFDGWHMWGGNAQHTGRVEGSGIADRFLLASLERPGQGTMRRVAFETDAPSPALVPAAEPPELPLSRTEVDAEISGMVAQVVVTQQFRNPYDRPIEAVYLFPLPQDAAVNDMEMRMGDRVVRAQIKRRNQARRIYSDARSEGRRAALLEQQRPNLFAQRVANIQPGERIDVRIRYIQMLPFTDGSYEFLFPMVAPRRYDPDNPIPTATVSDPLAPDTAAGEAPAVAAALAEVRTRREVEVRLSLDAGLPVSDIVSTTHRIEVERESAQRATVTLAEGEANRAPDRDFVVRYHVSGSIPRAAVFGHRDETGGYFSLVVQPPEAPQENSLALRNFTFVVDTSSSMAGRPLEQVRQVVAEVLRGLRPTDSFNILSFSDGVERLSQTALPGSDENVERAEAYLDGLSAAGATEMVPAIDEAMRDAAAHVNGRDGGINIVVLLTDGFIANEAEVFRVVAEQLRDTRVYGLGVGSAVNRFLLERVAEMGRGRAIVATLSEQPSLLAERFASFVERPVFTDVTVDWGGLDVEDVYPRRLPDLFAGQPLIVHGRYGEGGSTVVRVRGNSGARRYERAFSVELPTTALSNEVSVHGVLWARAAVHDRMNRLYLRDDPTLIEEVTDIGLRHRMVTQWTSFVAVDEGPDQGPTAQEDESDQAGEAVRPTLSPARSLPGDPEVRIPAPPDALAVTIILPFGETVDAVWEPELSVWSGRFLVPRDAEDGVYPVRVIISQANGTQEQLLLWYTVDSAAPLVEMEVLGDLQPNSPVTLRARQVITDADLEQLGIRRSQVETSRGHAVILSDARRVQVAPPGGEVIDLQLTAPGTWQAPWRIPSDAVGEIEMLVVVADVAANVRTQSFSFEVSR